MDSDEVRRRVKAARALAGLSVPELAKRIGQRGLGERTLRELEGSAGRPFRPMELREIARACDLPYAFFTSDFWLLQALEEYWPDEEQALGRLADLSEEQIIEAAFNALRTTKTPEVLSGPDATRRGQDPEAVKAEIESLWERVAELSELVAHRAGLGPDDVESVLRGATRRTKQLLADRADEIAQETGAAASTRDEEDANPGEAPPRAAATPRSGRTTAR